MDIDGVAGGRHGDPSGGESSLRSIVRILASLGSLALFSSMLYYFGWVHTAAQARYFGFDSTFYDMSSADYTIRSTSAALPSFAAGVVIVLASICLTDALNVRLAPGSRARRTIIRALSVGGIGLVLAGVLGLPGTSQSPSIWPATTLIVGGGLTCVGLALSDARMKRAVMIAALLLAVVGAFHAVRVYAMSTGFARAKESALEMDRTAIIQIYATSDPQLLPLGSVQRTVLTTESGEIVYRYDCLHLLDRIGDRLLLVPHGYSSDANRRVVYVVDVDVVRVDFDVRYVARNEQPPCG